MSDLRFDGKVAVVTGAGGALGRAYALLLASRGASVVVNDLGSSAQKLVDEIKMAGGKAVADTNNVLEGEKIVQTAIDTFGRIDIVINNAGILRDVSFGKMTQEQWNIIQQVHVEGAWRVTKAAWPHLLKQKYGRIIMTSSASGLYGNGGQANYSAAKLALVGLANTLAKEGQKSGVYTNTIAPVAGSKMTETVWPPEMVEALSPQYVAPVVAYLCHESSKENGGVYESGGGFCAKVHYQRSEGVHFPIKGGAFTPEAIAARWTEINSFERNATYPTALNDSMAAVMAGIGQAPVQMGRSSANKQVQARSTNGTESKAAVEGQFASDIIFQGLAALVKADPTIPQRLNAIVQYNVTNAKKEKKVWIASLRKKDGAGSIAAGELQRDDNRKPDVTIDVSDADYCDLAAGKATAQMLYMKGRLKMKGSLPTAMKFDSIIKAAQAKAKL